MERPIEEEDHDPTLFSPDSTKEYDARIAQYPVRDYPFARSEEYDSRRDYQREYTYEPRDYSEPRRTSRDREQDYYYEGYAQASRSGGDYYRDKYYRDQRYFE